LFNKILKIAIKNLDEFIPSSSLGLG